MPSIKKIAEFLNIKSNNSSVIHSVTNQSDDGSLRLSWAKDELNLKKIISGAVICNRETFNKIEPVKDVEYLIVDNPRLAFAIVVNEFFSDFIPDYFTNLHSIHRGNEKVRIGSNVFIGKNVVLGEGCIIHDNVSIYPNSFIGKNCVIKSFASIGTEGLGQEFDSRINAYVKFPQIGGVEIGDNVEIGPYSTIRRSALGTTTINHGTKIGSYCNIGHNCDIGKNCLLTSNVIIAGSSSIEDDVYIGIGALIRNKVKVAKNATIGLGAVVIRNVPKNETWVGNPAKKIK